MKFIRANPAESAKSACYSSNFSPIRAKLLGVNQKIAVPRDAAAVILIRDDKVLWAQRNPQIKFLGGWHAFPGGKTDAGDAEIAVKNCEDAQLVKFIVSAARECFEEVGVLLVRNGEKLTAGQRASLHDDLTSGRSTFAEILDHWNLHLDAADFRYTGFWTTPQFSPVRFKTRFFLVRCPEKQMPYAAISEMLAPEFIAPRDALLRWENSEVLIAPPVLIALQELAKESESSEFEFQNCKNIVEILLARAEKCDGAIDYMQFNPRVTVFPLAVETLPPATHTNCFIVGGKEFVVIDAAAREPAEQAKLFALIDEIAENGGICQGIIVSHLHPDHYGGEKVLQTYLHEKHALDAPISAHRLTAEGLRGKVEFQKFVEDNQKFLLKDDEGESFELTALHAPGHARGHLCFYDEQKGFLLSSDNVLSLSSTVIAPPEGNLTDYLNSLERLENLPNLRFLCGSHGTAVYDAKVKIAEYITHRLEREREIVAAIEAGAKTPREIVEKVYAGIDEKLLKLAEKSVEAHLEKLYGQFNPSRLPL